MRSISRARHRFPPIIFQHVVPLDLRFDLSCREVEDLLAECGTGVSRETVRRWTRKLGAACALRIRELRS